MRSPQLIEILLVEDNDDDVVLIRRAFQQTKGLSVSHVVTDGEEVTPYLHQQGPHREAQHPGLILLDINMPKKDGFQVLAELKADPAVRHIPVVMLTTSQREEDVVRSYRQGACSFISKPHTFQQLQEIIQQFERYWTSVSRVPGATT